MSWFAEDGLMKLDPWDERAPFGNAPFKTVNNANGILFKAIYELLCFRSGILKQRDDFLDTVDRLEDKTFEGMYLRHPEDHISNEAQDNTAGICAGSMLYSHTIAPQRIVSRGTRNGFNFNNLGPTWEAWAQRQGGERALYSLAAGFIPDLFDWIWFCGGVLFNAFGGKPTTRNHVSDAQLAWIRLEGLTHRIGATDLPFWVAPTYWIVRELWNWRTEVKYGHELMPIALYYTQPDHPNRVMANKLMGKE